MEGGSPQLVWQAYPAHERAGRTISGIIAIIAVSLLVTTICVLDGLSLTISILWGIGAGLILVMALNRFFFPSKFEIDEDGITARYLLKTQRLSWADIKRFLHDEYGGYLSTRVRRSRLDAWKGMHILFGSNRDEAIQSIKSHLSSKESE